MLKKLCFPLSREDLCRPHKRVFQHQRSLQACQAENNLLKTSLNYRVVGKKQSPYSPEKQSVFSELLDLVYDSTTSK